METPAIPAQHPKLLCHVFAAASIERRAGRRHRTFDASLPVTVFTNYSRVLTSGDTGRVRCCVLSSIVRSSKSSGGDSCWNQT